MDTFSENFKFRLTLTSYSAQKKSLSHVVEDGSVRDSGLLEDLVSQPSKTQDINIEDPFLRGFRNDLLLGLHRILIRDNDHIVAAGSVLAAERILRLFQYHIVEQPALSRP